MADAESLRKASLSGLESLANTDERAYADAMYQRTVDPILRQYEEDIQAQRENLNARGLYGGAGLGLNTYLNDRMKKLEDSRAEALIRARREADLAARSATLAALGQAASAAQTDLSRQAGATNADANRQMQAKALDRQEGIANRQMLVGGLGSLGAAGLYGGMRSGAFKGLGDSIASGARGLFASNGGGAASPGFDAQRLGERGDYSTSFSASPATSDFDMEGAAFGSGGADFGLESLGGLDYGGFDSGVTDFLPQLSEGWDFGGGDALSGLDLLSFGVDGAGMWDWTSGLADWTGW